MPFALITGASKGIGKAITEELAARGYDLLLVARSESILEELAEEMAASYKVVSHIFAQDLALPNAAESVYEWTSVNNYSPTILVNNAGYGLSGPFEKYSPQQHAEMMQLNMITLVKLCRFYLPDMRRQPAAYIMNIASSAAYQAVPFLSAYAASKSFVLSFSRGLHQELEGSGVSITCVSPGATDTNFITRAQVGVKGQKAAERFNMSPEAVANIAVKGLFAKKAEVITGFTNKLGAAMAWLLPKTLVEKTIKKLYS